MARFSFNGGDIVGGHSISIRDGKVIVDGVDVTDTVNKGDISGGKMELRIVEGTIQNLDTDRSVSCGAITGDVNAGGSVNADNIKGSVKAGGSVNCDNIGGDVRAGGSVNCDDIGGSVTASVVKRG